MRPLNVLIACEASGTVRDAFRELGHNAWSCDILGPDSEPAGFTPAQWADVWIRQKWGPQCHLVGDCMEWLGPDGYGGEPWDIVIAHPPCTYLTNAGARWLYKGGRGTVRDSARWDAMHDGARFFRQVSEAARTARIGSVLENPIMHKHAMQAVGSCTWRERQIIQPYDFGTPETKATVLWLDRLPLLRATKYATQPIKARVHHESPRPNRWWFRSLTDPNIAAAMAAQWGAL